MIIDRKQFNLQEQCVLERLRIKTPFKYAAVFQNEACFLYMKQGKTLLQSPVENLTLHASESVLLKCGNYFANLLQQTKSEVCEIYAVHLHPGILKQLYHDEIPGFVKPDTQKHFARKTERQDIVVHFINSLDFYFDHPHLVSDELLKLKMKELILLLLQTSHADNVLDLFAHLFTARQASLREVIQAHLFSNLTVEELAKLSGRSLSAFKRDFEQAFNDTPAHYLKEQKLTKAQGLLLATDLSVLEICYEVGYNDASHFTKLFRQKFHASPTAYRKMKRANS